MPTSMQWSVPAVMKGIQVTEYGGLDVLKMENQLPVPNPSPTQVLINVKFAAVNTSDTLVREGTFVYQRTVPFIPGIDGAGAVVAVGDQVSKFKAGDRVYFYRSTGSYAEYTIADEWAVHKLHDSISYKGGAAIGVPYFTAYRALVQKAKGKAAECVLVHGASGAIGIASVQIARACGMTVLGTAGTAGGMELVKRHGAHRVFNHNEKGYLDQIRESTRGKGVDVVLDIVSDVNLQNDIELMARNGRIAIIGNNGAIEVSLLDAMIKEVSILGVSLLRPTKSELEEYSAFISAGQEQGWVKPEVGQEYSLSEVQTAHREILAHTGGSRGRIVLNINGDCSAKL